MNITITRSQETPKQSIERAMLAFSRDTNEGMTNSNDSAERQSGRSADDTIPGDLEKSKIVDKTGKLLRVYHGTDDIFDIFDETKGSRGYRNESGKMFFFTFTTDGAQTYGENIVSAHLNLKRPLSKKDARSVVPKKEWKDAYDPSMLIDGTQTPNLPSWEYADALAEKAREVGADGFFTWDGSKTDDGMWNHVGIAVLDGNQIKIIIPNESTAPTNGDDASNPDINFSHVYF